MSEMAFLGIGFHFCRYVTPRGDELAATSSHKAGPPRNEPIAMLRFLASIWNVLT